MYPHFLQKNKLKNARQSTEIIGYLYSNVVIESSVDNFYKMEWVSSIKQMYRIDLNILEIAPS